MARVSPAVVAAAVAAASMAGFEGVLRSAEGELLRSSLGHRHGHRLHGEFANVASAVAVVTITSTGSTVASTRRLLVLTMMVTMLLQITIVDARRQQGTDAPPSSSAADASKSHPSRRARFSGGVGGPMPRQIALVDEGLGNRLVDSFRFRCQLANVLLLLLLLLLLLMLLVLLVVAHLVYLVVSFATVHYSASPLASFAFGVVR
mmetsp:Transcript_21101/g.45575  ORF Transcript_21101/g.45575 Transcript_21101/m.45575 type:complete len:205 (+) Transcript_21101:200-814(+)